MSEPMKTNTAENSPTSQAPVTTGTNTETSSWSDFLKPLAKPYESKVKSEPKWLSDETKLGESRFKSRLDEFRQKPS